MACRIAIASDHAGFELKEHLAAFLKREGHSVTDFGAKSIESVDYPEYGAKAAQAVSRGECDYGCVICHSGIGMSIVANKVRGVRAALCMSPKLAELSRQHNNANVLCLAAGFTPAKEAEEILKVWLKTPFEGGRHERRVNKIKDYEA